jgi:hypothetical protein
MRCGWCGAKAETINEVSCAAGETRHIPSLGVEKYYDVGAYLDDDPRRRIGRVDAECRAPHRTARGEERGTE